ncbi:MAG: hypothetical protein JST16_10720 [Bdellovibrionales bacterium]|nr:hypothetical protein [Bdellovibrionales bacterium]
MASWKPREHAPLEQVVVTLPPDKLKAALAEIAKVLYNHFSQSDFIAPASTYSEPISAVQSDANQALEAL